MGIQGRDDRNEPAAGNGRRGYINHMNLRLSLSEVLIDVGQTGPGEVPTITGRFVTSPDYLLSMRSTISGAIDRYQAEFGGIVSAGPGAGRG
ncbi:MAG TPA: hypothetical protein VFQ67_07390 [Allosphingosinicella sp.]|jgi:hypothetical protein|nr:hypothetical protein [Allosphingosinicella sp.]